MGNQPTGNEQGINQQSNLGRYTLEEAQAIAAEAYSKYIKEHGGRETISGYTKFLQGKLQEAGETTNDPEAIIGSEEFMAKIAGKVKPVFNEQPTTPDMPVNKGFGVQQRPPMSTQGLRGGDTIPAMPPTQTSRMGVFGHESDSPKDATVPDLPVIPQNSK